MNRFIPLLLLLLLLLALGACKENGNGPDPVDSFDRAAMLDHYASELIVPAFARAQSRADALAGAVDALAGEPTAARVEATRTAWLAAVEAWQAVSMYNFGPAEDNFGTLNENLGTWPVDTQLVETFIADGNISVANFARDSRGFYGLEYLLFRPGSAQAVADALASDTDRAAYLRLVAEDLATRLGDVAQAWDSYQASFVANDGTDAGSSVSLLYNEFVKSFEAIKNFKVGVPLGKRPGQTQTEPARVEAYFSGQSVALSGTHLDAIERLWYGTGLDGTEGPGFYEYLETVTGGPELITATEEQWGTVRDAYEAVVAANLPLDQLIKNQPALVETFHTELQRHTRFFKSDMSSLLGITITFSSGDGD
jgi:uncharacterized protein